MRRNNRSIHYQVRGKVRAEEGEAELLLLQPNVSVNYSLWAPEEIRHNNLAHTFKGGGGGGKSGGHPPPSVQMLQERLKGGDQSLLLRLLA